jgi:hypothetical protein
VSALTGLALIAVGAVFAGPLWYKLAVRDERIIRRLMEKAHRAELDAALANPDYGHFTLWRQELRGKRP